MQAAFSFISILPPASIGNVFRAFFGSAKNSDFQCSLLYRLRTLLSQTALAVCFPRPLPRPQQRRSGVLFGNTAGRRRNLQRLNETAEERGLLRRSGEAFVVQQNICLSWAFSGKRGRICTRAMKLLCYSGTLLTHSHTVRTICSQICATFSTAHTFSLLYVSSF